MEMMRFPVSSVLLVLLAGAALTLSQSVSGDWQTFAKVSIANADSRPEDFGLSVPFPEPALPPDVDPFNPPAHATGVAMPAIAEISRTGDRNEVISMTGIGLDRKSVFRIFSQPVGAHQGNLTTVNPLTADKTAATVLLPSTLPPWSMYFIWPQRGSLQGPAVAINRTEAWWIGPEKAAPGTVVSVYGRNLARSNGTTQSHIYIKPVGGAGWYLTPRSVNPFRVEFEIPDLPSATYEVWTHNSHGGRFGWSGPLLLDILAQSPWHGQDKRIIDVRHFGAQADGIADDTHAVAQALEAAGRSAPATIYFPAGQYRIMATLHAPANVTWAGDGMDETEIRLGKVINDSMIVSPADNVGFRKLTLTGDRRSRDRPLVNLSFAKEIRFEAVRLDAWGSPALEAQDVSGLFIDASELIENGSFYGASRQIFMSGNRFRMTGYGESAVALWGGRDFSMIGNELTNADESLEEGHGIGRFFVGQAHFGSMRNLYWEGNVSRNAAPHDCDKVDCNKGEQICFEIVGSRLKNDFVSATESTVTFRRADWGQPVASGRDLVIVGGRGAGQQRHIVSVNGSTAMLESAWRVMPDRTSRFALAATASRAAIYRNTFEGRESYSQHDSDSTGVLLYGNVYDVVVDSNTISKMRHGMMTVALASSEGLSPYFLQYSNNRISRSNSGLYVGTTFADSGLAGIWGGLGNVYRRNIFEDIAYIGVEYESWDHLGSDYNGTVFDANRFTGLRYGFIDGYKLMWTHDGRFKEARPERPRRINTILHNNEFDRGSADFAGSEGFLTLHAGNTWVNIGSKWTGFSIGNEGPIPLR
jgi:polygalacturonase